MIYNGWLRLAKLKECVEREKNWVKWCVHNDCKSRLTGVRTEGNEIGNKCLSIVSKLKPTNVLSPPHGLAGSLSGILWCWLLNNYNTNIFFSYHPLSFISCVPSIKRDLEHLTNSSVSINTCTKSSPSILELFSVIVSLYDHKGIISWRKELVVGFSDGPQAARMFSKTSETEIRF